MSGSFQDYLMALRVRESGGNYQVVNAYGFLGAYQFGEAALVDLGFVNLDSDPFDNVFSGGFTGKLGINSVEDFLASPDVQDIALAESIPLTYSYMQGMGLESFIGTVVAGIEITMSGIFAGSHLLGLDNVRTFLESAGATVPQDAFGTPISEYISMFGGYDLPIPVNTTHELHGTADGDFMFATAVNDLLFGGEGDDTIQGWGGEDTLNGDSGNDALYGGTGSDQINSNGGADIADGGEGDDVITLTPDSTFGSGFYALNVDGPGQAGTNVMLNLTGYGQFRAVTFGQAGYDTIKLSVGNDAFFLHDAVSSFHSDLTLDPDSLGYHSTARFSGIERILSGAGDDIIDLTSPDYSLAAESLLIDAGTGDDVIWGSDADETIIGGDGNDTIFSGSGSDRLAGGAGADVFEFTWTSQNVTIADFAYFEGDILRFYDTYEAQFLPESVEFVSGGLAVSYYSTISGQNEVLNIVIEGADVWNPYEQGIVLGLLEFV